MNKFIPSIEISNYYRFFELVKTKNGHYALYRGVYSHNDSQTGGPFFTYSWNNNELKMLYFL